MSEGDGYFIFTMTLWSKSQAGKQFERRIVVCRDGHLVIMNSSK
jgi:hypothetical protein